MTKPTTDETAIFDRTQYHVTRHVSVSPRTPVFQAQVNGTPTRDSKTGGIYKLKYDNVTLGAYTDIDVDMSLDIGTTPGARDIGTVRVRKSPTAATLFIAETAPGKVPIQDGHYLTVVDEYRIWQRLWRLVTTSTSTYQNRFKHFKDYDVAYDDQNRYPPPVACILHSVTADGEYIPPKLAGFVDPGQTYRTVALYALGHAIAKGATISGYQWDIVDGTLVDGTLTSQSITVRFPASRLHRTIKLTVTDSNGKTGRTTTSIYVHDATHPPLSNFEVERDERSEGRDMALVWFGNPDALDEQTIPRRAECVYWEQARFGADPAPDPYIAHFKGWAQRETTLFKLGEDRWTLELGGAVAELRNIAGPVDSLKYRAVPKTWSTMTSITADRLVAGYLLPYHTTALNVCNYKPSGNTSESKAETIPQGSIWDQLTHIAAAITAKPRCDSYGTLELKLQTHYMEAADRAAVPVAKSLTPDKWFLDDGLTIPEDLQERVGLIEVGGKSWDGTTEQKYLARAPGRTMSHAPARENPPGFILDAEDALDNLLRWAGHHWEYLNNPQPDVSIVLIGNQDHIHPGDVVRLTYEQPNLRGTTITTRRYVVTRVSVQHSNDPLQPPKRITLAMEMETDGKRGQRQPIAKTAAPTNDALVTRPPTITFPSITLPPVPTYRWDDFPAAGAAVPAKLFMLGSVGGQAKAARAYAIAAPAVWEDISTGLSGSPQFARSDPFDYRRRFATTSVGLFVCDNIWDSVPVWELVIAAEDWPDIGTGHYLGQIQMSINRKGFIAGTSGKRVYVSPDYGQSWSYAQADPGRPGGTTAGSYNTYIDITHYNEGYLYALTYSYYSAGFAYVLSRSTDWGGTFTVTADPVYRTDAAPPYWNAPYIPYKRPDGTPNTHGGGLGQVYTDSRVQVRKYGGDGTLSLGALYKAVGGSGSYHNGPGMVINTNDSNHVWVTDDQEGADARKSLDNLTSWHANYPAPFPSIGYQASINGFPNNPDYLLYWDDSKLNGVAVTLDGGPTWTTIQANVGAESWYPKYVEMDLSDWIAPA